MQLVCLALRVMGLEDDALAAGGERARQTVRQSFSDATDVPMWPGAQEALAYAYEHGFLYGLCYQDRTRFRPDTPATRLEVVVTLLEAMGLREQAQAMSRALLNAPDAASVPSWARGYIALALEMGLLRGDERGYLQPNASVTREQMAAFLRRADRHADSEADDNFLCGVVAEVLTGEQPSVTVLTTAGQLNRYRERERLREAEGTASGEQQTTQTETQTEAESKEPVTVVCPVAPDCEVYMDGQKVALADLVVGARVEVLLAEGLAVIIDAWDVSQGKLCRVRVQPSPSASSEPAVPPL